MSWAEQESVSRTSDRRVELRINFDRSTSPAYSGLVSPVHNCGSWQESAIGPQKFQRSDEGKAWTAREEIGHANRVVADHWYSVLCTKDNEERFWEKEAVLGELGPRIDGWLRTNLTDVYGDDQ